MRTALIADFCEEGWLSMDLVAEMLLQNTGEAAFEFELVRPGMRRRFSRTNRGLGFTTDRLLNRFHDYPRFLRKRRTSFDLFHILDHSYSQLVHVLPANRTVVTCHDLDTFRCLWEPKQAGRGFAFVAMTRRILSGFRSAAHICCDSIAIRDELLERKLLPPEKVSVVPLGIHPLFFQEPEAGTESVVDAMLKNEAGRFVDLLHVGSVIARKRIDILLELFARLRTIEPRARLVRVGGEFSKTQQRSVEKLGLTEKIITLPFLTTEQLAVVYRRAALLLLPSDREGFGLPVLEAMASGTPVLVSDLPVLREVGEGAAAYAPVADIAAWVEIAGALLAERQDHPQRWEERRERCRERATKFPWNATANRTAEVYRRVLQAARA